jgi:hypothetical protein
MYCLHLHIYILKMKVECSSETLVTTYKTAVSQPRRLQSTSLPPKISDRSLFIPSVERESKGSNCNTDMKSSN